MGDIFGEIKVFGKREDEQNAPQINIFGGGGAQLPQQEDEVRQIEQSLPWWYRAASFVTSGLDPLAWVASLGRAAAFDIFWRKPGEPSEFRRVFTLENFLRAAPFGDRPAEAVPGAEIAERMGIKSKTGKFVAGFLLEAAFDPTNWATLGGAALIKGATKEAAKIATKRLGRSVASYRDMLEAAKELERVGDPYAAKLFRLAAMRNVGEKMISPSAWLPEPTRRAIEKAFIGALERVPTPFNRELVTEQGVTQVPMSAAELLLTPGTYARGVAKGAQEEAARNIFGSADVVKLGVEDYGAFQGSLLDYAGGLGNYFAARGLALAREVPKRFERAAGKSVDEARDLYEVWSKAIADWLDNLQSDIDPSLLPIVSGQQPGEELARQALERSKLRRGIYKRIAAYAEKVGADPDKLFREAEELARAHYLYAAEIGYHLSGMPKYYEAVSRAADELGVPAAELRIAIAKKALGKKLTEAEDELVSKAKELIQEYDPFKSIDVEEYLRNLQQGYFRRVLGLHLDDPNVMRKILEGVNRGVRWFPSGEIDANALVEVLGRKGRGDEAERLAAYLFAYGDGAVSVKQLSRVSGIPEDDLIDALYELEVRQLGPEFREIIEKSLNPNVGKRPAFGLVGRRLFKERTLPKKFESDFLPISGLAERTAALASSSRRAITGQEIIRGIYDELSKADAIWDEPANWITMTAEDGTKLFRVPDIPSLYGPLAGKYIPRYAANVFLRAVETGDPHWYQKALANLRVGWLANPATISRNISGGLLMLNAAGLSPVEIAKYGKQANSLIRQINKTGDITILGPGAEALNLFGEGTLAGEAADTVSRALDDILGSIAAGKNELAKKRIKKLAADAFTGRPLFNLFQYSEDVMRLTAFLAARDRLRRALAANTPEELERVNRIAATIANNILFDYSSQPEMVRILKRTGLMMFPSFSVFNAGRTARLALTRPAALTNINHLTNASYAFLDDDEKQLASLAVGASWMADEQPLFLGGDNGTFYVMPMRNLFPRIASLDFTQTAYEPLSGGILQGIIDVAVAYASDSGKGPFSSRYGQRVFEVGTPPLERTGQTALFLARKYAPGFIRSGIDVAEHVWRRWRSKDPDAVFKAFSRTYARSPDELLIRNLGIPYYKTTAVKYKREIDAIDDKYSRIISEIKKELKQAAVAGDLYRVQRLQKRLMYVREQWMKEVQKVLGVENE